MSKSDFSDYTPDIVDFVLDTPFGEPLSYDDVARAFKMPANDVESIVSGLNDAEKKAVSRVLRA
ncbi:MAG: hypothetical protein AAGB25_05230 [Pseudomonadota bacterium]